MSNELRKMKFVTKYSAYRVADNGKLKPYMSSFNMFPYLHNRDSKEDLLRAIAKDSNYHHEDIAIVEVVRYVWDDDE